MEPQRNKISTKQWKQTAMQQNEHKTMEPQRNEISTTHRKQAAMQRN